MRLSEDLNQRWQSPAPSVLRMQCSARSMMFSLSGITIGFCMRCKIKCHSRTVRAFLKSECCPRSDQKRASAVLSRPTALARLSEVRVGSKVVHASHVCSFFGGWWWCWRCGCCSNLRLRGLALPCVRPTRKGLDVLARVRRGLPPPGQRWSDGSDLALFPSRVD